MRSIAGWAVSGSLLLFACGGGTEPSGPPGVPSAVSKLSGTDNQTANAGEAVAVQPAVKVVDSNHNPVSGVTVGFRVTSGGGGVTAGASGVVYTASDGVARVASWVLGTTPGVNTLVATVDATGVSDNPVTFTATSVLTALNPSANTSLSGNKYYSSVNIPAGITVTLTGALTLNVTGALTIAGSLVGDCQALVLNADGALSVSGTLDNGCPGGIPAAGAPAMTLVGKGGYSFAGNATVLAGGNVTITDDPTATDADFAPAASPYALRALGPRRSIGVPCNLTSLIGAAKPTVAPTSSTAKDAGTWVLRCKGGADLAIGTLSLTAQHGGVGLDQSGSNNPNPLFVLAQGGPGGKGGTVKLQGVGSITLGGGTIRTGNGGGGGNAVAQGSPGGAGAAGQDAVAIGGPGGSPGLFVAAAKNGSIAFLGPITLQIGNAGDGGAGTALGGDGHDAEPCPATAGGAGGAGGGAGGTTPDKGIQAAGGVTGLANLTVTGGAAGRGGKATGTGGKGGIGAKLCKSGAPGGPVEADGGPGGDANLTNQSGVLIANGGNGGDLEVKNAKGGRGWSGCVAPFEAGGPGGSGGTAFGLNGRGGSGLSPGSFGAAIFNLVSNGGNGGDGISPGSGGPPGANEIVLTNVAAAVIQPSFAVGNSGQSCS